MKRHWWPRSKLLVVVWPILVMQPTCFDGCAAEPDGPDHNCCRRAAVGGSVPSGHVTDVGGRASGCRQVVCQYRRAVLSRLRSRRDARNGLAILAGNPKLFNRIIDIREDRLFWCDGALRNRCFGPLDGLAG